MTGGNKFIPDKLKEQGIAIAATNYRLYPKVKCPVLMFHGLKDKALLPGALNDTWNWVEKELTLITLPDTGHFVQQDAADRVTRNMLRWLTD